MLLAYSMVLVLTISTLLARFMWGNERLELRDSMLLSSGAWRAMVRYTVVALTRRSWRVDADVDTSSRMPRRVRRTPVACPRSV